MYSDNANRQPKPPYKVTTVNSPNPQYISPTQHNHTVLYSTRPPSGVPTIQHPPATPKKRQKKKKKGTQPNPRQPPNRHPARRRPILGKARQVTQRGRSSSRRPAAFSFSFSFSLLFSSSPYIPCTCPVPIYDLYDARPTQRAMACETSLLCRWGWGGGSANAWYVVDE